MTVVLIGPPAAGKTRIGKRVARLLGVPFVDTDKLIVAAHGPIPEIFSSKGEPHFRSLERAEVVRALDTSAVVSFGGGAVLDPETQRDIAALPVVLLTVQPHAVESRLGNGKRPLVPDLASWIALYEKRRDLYERLADHVVDTSDRPTDQVAADLAGWVRSRTASQENAR
ncbi:shikimate kinase [Herbiconiux sp. CPCC 203407]|uniref:Shikimate kinase n=1 Tax=Herbiconiux oxytropis TaxID=2970915 RepID=A0AA41XD29_9MICO|nr:shikimate kinase [Herbiconiux oxytropis]MCS5720428.1 shikimate kinase [Herbiconiux oxytropis]MCS5726001.1 shikimate kinase [Herbiconiux oxytropis]